MQSEEKSLKQLRNFISYLVPINDTDWEEFSLRLKMKTFHKGDILTYAGEVENYMYFMFSGLCRIFHMRNGVEYTLRFNFPISAFNSYASFITRTPSLINVEAITDVSTFRISYNDMQTLYEEAPSADRVGRRLIEILYVEREMKELSIHTLTAEDMYCELLKENKELAEHIPQKYLASYLGIAPESLSRIKKVTINKNKQPIKL